MFASSYDNLLTDKVALSRVTAVVPTFWRSRAVAQQQEHQFSQSLAGIVKIPFQVMVVGVVASTEALSCPIVTPLANKLRVTLPAASSSTTVERETS